MADASQPDGHNAPIIRVDAAEEADAAPTTARSAAGSQSWTAASSDDAYSRCSRDAPVYATPAQRERQAALAAEIQQLLPRTPPGMVDPNSARKLAWDWLVVCFVVFTTLATPLDLAFFDADCRRYDPKVPPAAMFGALTRACGGEAGDAAEAYATQFRFALRTACKPAALEALDRVVDVIFWLDIALTFCTGIVRERECTVDYRRLVVAREYASRGLLPDALSALPLDVLGNAISGNGSDGALALKLLRLPRLLRLSRLLRKLEHASSATLFRVSLLVGTYVLIGHWAACLFFYLSKWQLWNSAGGWATSGAGLRPWLVTQCLQFANTPTRYTAALYWAITTMATVGFGDITPGTNMERCFAMALQLVAGVLQGVVFGNIGVALAGFDRASAAVKARQAEASALARAVGLPTSLAKRLVAAVGAQAEAERGLEVGDALRDVSGGLRVQAEAATAGARALTAAPLFRGARPPLPRGFAAAVARRLRVLALLPGELAACAGDADGAAHVLLRGACVREPAAQSASALATLDDATLSPLTVLRAGALFGDAEAVLCRRTPSNVRAVSQTTLLAVTRDSLDAALSEFPEALAPLTASCLAREADANADDARAAAAAAQLVAERLGGRRSGRMAACGSLSDGGAILDASVPMLASLRSAGLGRAARRGGSGGDSGAAPDTSAPAPAARWGKAGAAARMVVRLTGVAHATQNQRAAAEAQKKQTHRAATPDPLASADWSGFNARLRAVVAAQAASFETCGARLDAVADRQGALVDAASQLLL